MSGIRIKFIRGEEVKYISHLDLMRAFERAVRRSHIPVAYSHGFNPHPQMVFGLPLPVGVTSETEYADFELEGSISPADFVEKLNRQLPIGLNVVAAGEKHGKTNIMATIVLAEYRIDVSLPQETSVSVVGGWIEKLMNMDGIKVEKEGKRGVREVEIRPMIHKLAVGGYTASMNGGELSRLFQLSALLCAGSKANLKPELLITALNKTIGVEITIEKIHRTALFVESNGKVLDPLDVSALRDGKA